MIEFKYPEQRAEFEAYIQANEIPESRIWHDGEWMRIKPEGEENAQIADQ
jgi:hypothetical protein